MGKLFLRNVEISIDKTLSQDPQKTFDIEGDNFADLKATLNQLGHDVANEFGVNVNDVKVKNANFKENRFVIF